MKITLLMATTVDGVIAKDDASDIKTDRKTNDKLHPFNWLSKEDKKYFVTLSKKIGVLMMGSKSYIDAGRTFFKDRLLIVLTRNPDQFGKVPSSVIFKAGTPKDIIKDLEEMGITEILLGGGTNVNAEFLNAGLVDEIHLTIEPKIFGRGQKFVDYYNLDIDLELIECSKLNDTGTLLLKYNVIRD